MSLIIKSQKSSSDIIKFNPKAALFVCNRWDMVTDENKRAVRQNAIDQLSKAWPDFDPKNAVFFSTYQAQREQSANPGYVTEDFVALLHGLHDLVAVSYDKRIKASYRLDSVKYFALDWDHWVTKPTVALSCTIMGFIFIVYKVIRSSTDNK